MILALADMRDCMQPIAIAPDPHTANSDWIQGKAYTYLFVVIERWRSAQTVMNVEMDLLGAIFVMRNRECVSDESELIVALDAEIEIAGAI